LQSCQSGDKLYERIDATLVEKAMGSPELYLALELSWRLRTYLQTHDLGFLYAPDALMALRTDLIRSPDVSFVPWTRRPERTVSTDPISREIPALVVEILSPGNTEGEMQRKIAEYHDAGVAVVWVIDSSFLGRGYPVPRGTVGI
jgi:Uma2 family endonuclease